MRSHRVFPWLILALIVFWAVSAWPGGDSRPPAVPEQAGAEATATAKPGAPPQPVSKGEVLVDVLNFRSGQDTANSAIIGALKKGTVFEVLERRPEWLKVKLDDGQSGYVFYMAGYVRFLEP